MAWLFFVILSSALYGWSSILDNYLSDKLFRKTIVLVFSSFIFTLFLLPVVALIEKPELPPLSLLPFFLIIGLCEVLYLYPYYKALQNEDTAVVGSLFSLGKVFVPLLAFLFIGETVGPLQYLGFFIIIGSSSLLSLRNSHNHIRLNKSFFYMLAVSILIAIEAVTYKHILNGVNWSTGYIGAALTGVILALPILLVRPWRNDIFESIKTSAGNFRWLFLEELLTVAAAAVSVYAFSLAPATLVSGVFSVHPFIVLIYALLFSRFFPRFFKEKIDAKSVLKKLLLFAITILGIILIAQ